MGMFIVLLYFVFQIIADGYLIKLAVERNNIILATAFMFMTIFTVVIFFAYVLN